MATTATIFKTNCERLLLSRNLLLKESVCSQREQILCIKSTPIIKQKNIHQGPVVQSVVSLTNSLRIISLTVLADSIYNILIFFAEKM